MESSLKCALCLLDAGTGAFPLGGTQLCDQCFNGDAVRQAEKRGWRIEIETREWTSRWGQQSASLHGWARLGRRLFKVKFAPTTALSRIKSLLGLGLRVEDPTFRRYVAVLKPDRKAVSGLLADAGVRELLVELTAQGVDLRLQPDGDMVVWGSLSGRPYDQIALERVFALLLCHLELVAGDPVARPAPLRRLPIDDVTQ